jgi:hypothetical protein
VLIWARSCRKVGAGDATGHSHCKQRAAGHRPIVRRRGCGGRWGSAGWSYLAIGRPVRVAVAGVLEAASSTVVRLRTITGHN